MLPTLLALADTYAPGAVDLVAHFFPLPYNHGWEAAQVNSSLSSSSSSSEFAAAASLPLSRPSRFRSRLRRGGGGGHAPSLSGTTEPRLIPSSRALFVAGTDVRADAPRGGACVLLLRLSSSGVRRGGAPRGEPLARRAVHERGDLQAAAGAQGPRDVQLDAPTGDLLLLLLHLT